MRILVFLHDTSDADIALTGRDIYAIRPSSFSGNSKQLELLRCWRAVFELPRINTGQRPASQALCAGATKIKRQSQPVSGQVQPEGSQSRILA
jgi:hypothetical protein